MPSFSPKPSPVPRPALDEAPALQAPGPAEPSASPAGQEVGGAAPAPAVASEAAPAVDLDAVESFEGLTKGGWLDGNDYEP